MFKWLFLSVLFFLSNIQSQAFPAEHVFFTGSGGLVLDGKYYNQIGWILRDVSPGVYNSIALRPEFTTRPGMQTIDAITWDAIVNISYNVINPEDMSVVDSHNRNYQMNVVKRRDIVFPPVTAQYKDGGINALVAEPFSYIIKFDFPWYLPAKSNVCISIENYNFEPFGPALDTILMSKEWTTRGASSQYLNTGCLPPQSRIGFTNISLYYDGILKKYLLHFDIPGSQKAAEEVVFITNKKSSMFSVIYENLVCASNLDFNTVISVPYIAPSTFEFPNRIAKFGDSYFIQYASIDGSVITIDKVSHLVVPNAYSSTNPPNCRTILGGWPNTFWAATMIKLE